MIFSWTIDQVLSGRKKCTTRLQYAGDTKQEVKGRVVIMTASGRTRWIVGNVYAVQQERCHRAKGWIKIVAIERVQNPLDVSLAVAKAEGFDAVEAYQQVWHKIHKKQPIQPCWRIWFSLTARVKGALNG